MASKKFTVTQCSVVIDRDSTYPLFVGFDCCQVPAMFVCSLGVWAPMRFCRLKFAWLLIDFDAIDGRSDGHRFEIHERRTSQPKACQTRDCHPDSQCTHALIGRIP